MYLQLKRIETWFVDYKKSHKTKKIKEVIDSINKDLDKREKELIEFKSKYNIRIRGEPTPDKGEKKEEEKTGVLA